MAERAVTIARVSQDGSIQALEEHLRHVSESCASFLHSCGFYEVGKLLGLLHDLGKYPLSFKITSNLKQESYRKETLIFLPSSGDRFLMPK